MKRFLLWCSAILLSGPLMAAPGDFEDGTRAFFEADMTKALAAWDRQIADVPAEGPHHWQRGIALYYAGKFKEGRLQFEQHRKVNPQDVENAAWHFLCVAKEENPEAARKVFIPITSDGRVPMPEIHALFAGKGTAEAVLAAADKPPAGGGSLTNQRCYAHLYLGLHFEALGDPAKAKEHLLKAAGPFRMNHYMGRVAQVHCRLRKWEVTGGGRGVIGY